MNQVVLQIIDPDHILFINPGRILTYLNRFFLKYMDGMQYCEELSNGFLFIFRDWESFLFRTKPILAEQLKPATSHFLKGVNFYKFFFIGRKKFPVKGIDVQVKIITGDPKMVFPRVEKFIYSVDKRITITYPNQKILNFHIDDFAILEKYQNSLMNRFDIKKDE